MKQRLLSALCLLALLPACDQTTPAPKEQPKVATGRALETQTFVDPLTASEIVLAGLDFALKLKALFAKDPSSVDVAPQLDEIKAQNGIIIEQLQKVILILDNLGVISRQSTRAELLVHIRTTLGSNHQVYYETWQGELRDPKPATKRDADIKYCKIFSTVQPLARQIATPDTYGYAPFATVGQAMFTELSISERLDERSTFRREAARFYASYFDEVLDPTKAGSVGFQLAYAASQRDRLKKVLDDADELIRSGKTWTVAFRQHQRQQVRKEGRRTCTYNVYADTIRAITGNQESGFSWSDTYKYYEPELAGCEEPERTRPLVASSVPNERPDPPAARSDDPIGLVNYWNKVREVYPEVRAEAELLSKAAETARIYRDVAREVVARPIRDKTGAKFRCARP